MNQISNTYEKLFRMQEQLCSEYEGEITALRELAAEKEKGSTNWKRSLKYKKS